MLPVLAPDDAMGSFMNGFDFALVALRARLALATLPPHERARLDALLDEYEGIVAAYRAGRPGPERPAPFVATVPRGASN